MHDLEAHISFVERNVATKLSNRLTASAELDTKNQTDHAFALPENDRYQREGATHWVIRRRGGTMQ